MILGLGTDIVEINRIKKIIDKHNDSFLKKVFTSKELSLGKHYKDSAAFFAGRWAAKEAFSKALGTGIGESCNWTDIEITNNNLGRPECKVSGNALKNITEQEISRIHISISHEREYACSTVIFESDK